MGEEPLSDPRDYVLDLSSANAPQTPEPAPAAARKSQHLSILFECCNVYAPVYKNAAGTAYAGHCPKCLKPLRIAVGPGGSSSRVFRAS